MKKNIKNIALSTITIVMVGSHAYAGKIITDAGDPLHPIVVEDQQFGFGGWNFDNINVKIVNTSDFNTAIPGSSFDTATGIYTPMIKSMSFESEISTGGEVRGKLHGKDWPVGEPAGIKIINDDLNVGNGKPFNCIMTTSYQEYQITDDESSGTAYLDSFANGEQPRPTLCSSPFQTHKRFKINLLPSTVDGITLGQYGKPVEMTFNLDPTDVNTTNRRYQVLQKINNYTDKRLDGYRIEVLDENGIMNPALTLSLGEGEGLDEDGNPDSTVDIWGVEDVANMSHGLWGPYEKSGGVVRFDNGFFDYKTVYYDATLSDNNHTISYVGDMLGGNYQDLFGNWLPSIWAPTGIFHDDDHNPATDGILTAFLGVAPGYTERTWYKRTVDYDPNTPNVDPVYTWLPATAQDLQDWTGDWYEEDTVEDVLNLGVNYIVNIGLNSDIGATFTIRITPHIAINQTPPSSYDYFPALSLYTEGISKFVSRFYMEVFNRPSDSDGLTYWMERLTRGENAAEDIARGFINSDEFIQMETDNITYVTVLYKALFGRSPDIEGLNAWVTKLSNGVSRSSVLDGFIYSLEFTNVAKFYDIDPINTEITKIRTFVRRLYLTTLNRSADDEGLTDWSNKLASKQSTGVDIARGFILSPEFIARDTNNLTYLTILYKALFNRDPDTAGLNIWTDELNSGTSRYDVLDGFLFSQEFENLSQTYGIIAINP